MKTRSLGSTKVQVTELGFGAAQLGNLGRATDDQTASAAVDEAWDSGVRYFDTAPHYGLGLSERRLGAALAGRPRDEFVLSTKVGRLLEPNPAPTGSDLDTAGFDVPDDLTRRLDYSADGVRRSLDASLTRLGLDRVDIIYVHDPDHHVREVAEETLPALADLRSQGVVGAIGLGMNQWEAPLQLLDEGLVDVIMLAGRWTLLDRSAAPLMHACREQGVSIVAAAPYNSGVLSKERPSEGAWFDYGPASPEILARANDLADRSEFAGVSLPDAALQFALRHPVVASVVVGLRTPDQVRTSMQRLDVTVPESLWRDLDA